MGFLGEEAEEGEGVLGGGHDFVEGCVECVLHWGAGNVKTLGREGDGGKWGTDWLVWIGVGFWGS